MIEIMAAVETIFEHSKTDAIKRGATEAGEEWIKRALRGRGAKIWGEEMGKEVFAVDFAEAVDEVLRKNKTVMQNDNSSAT
jgi:hypothetical protein